MAIWQGPGGDYNTAANWDGNDVPDSSVESAVFTDNGAPTMIAVAIAADTNLDVGTLQFAADAPAFVFNLDTTPGSRFAIYSGIVNNSAHAPTFNGFTGGTHLYFADTASASNAVITTSGNVSFTNGSSLSDGTVNLSAGAILAFDGEATAANGTVVVDDGFVTADGDATLGDASISLSGLAGLQFRGMSSAGNAEITLHTGTTASFSGNASGGTAAFTLEADNSFAIDTADAAIVTVGSIAGAGSIFLGSRTLMVGGNDRDTTYSGQIYGDGGGLTKTGNGTFILSDNIDYTGATTVDSGTLQVDGNLGSDVTVHDGGTFAGRGKVHAVTVLDGGKLTPGAGAGVLDTENLAFAAGAVFGLEIGGTSAGSQYDQVAVEGTVTLAGATLSTAFINAFASSHGNSFVIIDNDGTEAVSGTFAGLDEGATVTLGGRQLSISYVGGTGNDVVLRDGVNQAPVLASLAGDTVTFTEDGPAIPIDSGTDATVSDDGASFQLGSLRVAIIGNWMPGEDLLSIADTGPGPGQLSISSTSVYYEGTFFATLGGSIGSNELVVNFFDTSATAEAVQALIRAVRYSNSNSANPSPADRTLRITLTDSEGAVSASDVTVHVAPANDAPYFGTAGDGVVTTTIGADARGRSVALQPDGKILLAGESDERFALVRYNANGSLDTSFDGDGKVTTAITIYSSGHAVTLQPDGRILVAGDSYNGSNPDFALARYNADGSLDGSFDGDGKVTTEFGANDTGSAIALQPDGKIVVAGTSGGRFALARYSADGSLDTSFDGDGKVITDLGSASALAVTVQADGNILVAGSAYNGSNTDFALLRYLGDGSLDTSFGTGGKVFTDFASASDDANSVTLQSDGKILLAGESNNGTSSDFALARYNTDGSLDASFDGDGKVTTDFGSYEYGQGVTVQPDGNILVAGRGSSGFTLARYSTDGSLDASFDGDGKVIITIAPFGGDFGYSVALQPDGKILVAGRTYDGAHGSFALVRLNTDGSLDTDFDGIKTLDAAPAFTENGAAVVLDSTVEIFDTELSPLDNFDGATLTLARAGGASAQDVFGASGALAALTTGGALVVSGTTIGTVTQNSAGTLVLTFNGNATQARVNTALSAITYANASDTPPASVTIDWTFSDGNSGAQGVGGPLTAAGSTTVTITAVDDAPVAQADSATMDEDSGATAIDVLANDTDVDGGAKIIAAVSQGAHGTVVITGDGTGLTYQPDGGYAGDDSFTYTLNGGSEATVSVTVNAVETAPPANAAPVNAVPGAQQIEANVATAIAGLSIADADAGAGSLTTTLSVAHGALTVASFGGAVVAGSGTGSVTLNGTLAQINATLGAASNVVYQGAHDYFGADTLTVTTSDNGNSGTGGPLVDTDQVSINLGTWLLGTPGPDGFTALPGNARIDAGYGNDTITFGFKLTDATVSWQGNLVIIDGPSGSHTVLTGFEKYIFADGTVDNADANRLVDDLFYSSQNHDVWNAHVDADAHYEASGWHERRDPNAFFSTVVYLSANPDVAAAGVNPLTHYAFSGWQEGRAPSLAFDTAAYLAANPDVAAAHVDPLFHFLVNGASEGRQPFALDALVTPNGFDYAYYLQNNPDVAAALVDPYVHFETTGWKEGRNPNAYFDTAGYLATYTDVKDAGINPLDHYNAAGWHEGRDPSVGFDTTAYLSAYPDVKAAATNPLAHFLAFGLHEGRSAQADGVWA